MHRQQHQQQQIRKKQQQQHEQPQPSQKQMQTGRTNKEEEDLGSVHDVEQATTAIFALFDFDESLADKKGKMVSRKEKRLEKEKLTKQYNYQHTIALNDIGAIGLPLGYKWDTKAPVEEMIAGMTEVCKSLSGSSGSCPIEFENNQRAITLHSDELEIIKQVVTNFEESCTKIDTLLPHKVEAGMANHISSTAHKRDLQMKVACDMYVQLVRSTIGRRMIDPSNAVAEVMIPSSILPGKLIWSHLPEPCQDIIVSFIQSQGVKVTLTLYQRSKYYPGTWMFLESPNESQVHAIQHAFEAACHALQERLPYIAPQKKTKKLKHHMARRLVDEVGRVVIHCGKEFPQK